MTAPPLAGGAVIFYRIHKQMKRTKRLYTRAAELELVRHENNHRGH